MAIQYADGHYEPLREPIRKSTVVAHLNGERTIGHYVVTPEDRCRFFAYDIDLTQTGTWTDPQGEAHDIEPRKVILDLTHPAREDLIMQLRCVADGLAMRVKRVLDVPVAIAFSGAKGLHVYGFTGSANSADVVFLANQVLDELGFTVIRGAHFFAHPAHVNLEIERFPKQETMQGKDLGNLMRLPLGVNRKSNQRGFFVDPRCSYTELRELDPLVALDGDPWVGEKWSDPSA